MPPQTVAIELEPFDSVMSETMRSEYGNSLLIGQHRLERAARKRTVPDLTATRSSQSGPTSPTE